MGASAHASQGDALKTGVTHGAAARLDVLESSSSLVERARLGDREAFEELVRLTYTELFALAYRLVGNEDDACDVLQDSYLRAYRSIESFRGDAAVSTWLYRITANCASTHLSRRRRVRHDHIDDAEHPADLRVTVDPEAMAGLSAERSRVATALGALPPRLRSVVVLRDIYDLSHEAIAQELGISEATAKVRLHRARKKLRERLFPVAEESLRAV